MDLMTVSSTCPGLHNEFEAGNFTLSMSGRNFSNIHPDQAHEQSNKMIKSIRGPINFVNKVDEQTQRKWEIVGPEIIQYLNGIEEQIYPQSSTSTKHHEDSVAFDE